jgi:carbonic anhydrase
MAMTKILDEVLTANAKYAENFGDKRNLPLPPSRHFAILTCMDARLDPAKYAGLAEGDAHVIRNAGGRASDDAIRSLVIFVQAPRHPRMVCNSPHGLWDAAVH